MEEPENLSFKNEIKDACKDLLFISETDEPLVYIEFADITTEDQLKIKLMIFENKSDTVKLKTETLGVFFKNAITVQPWFEKEEKETVKKFLNLKKVLEKNLKAIKVFKMGKVEQNVFILGKNSIGTFAGLKTKVVET